MNYHNEKNWYVLRVKSNSEHLAYFSLNKKQMEVLNPTYRVISSRKDRKKFLNLPIFKGYIFINIKLNSKFHLEILKTPGVIEFLNSSSGPTPVPNEQIQNVLILENYVGNIFFNTNFEIGDTVTVKDGPLRGLNGNIDKIDKKKLYIQVHAIPGSIMLEIDQKKVQSFKNEKYCLITKQKIFNFK